MQVTKAIKAFTYKPLNLRSLYSCHAQSPLIGVLFGIPTCGLSQTKLESSNYCTFTHHLSFVGIKERAAIVIDDEAQD